MTLEIGQVIAVQCQRKLQAVKVVVTGFALGGDSAVHLSYVIDLYGKLIFS